jgi:hypothetical protein
MPTTISGSGSADFHTALPVAEGGTGATASTGSGNVVLSASPTLTGTIGAAALTLTTPLPVASGGTGATSNAGRVLQVLQTVLSTSVSISTNGSWTAISGFSASITPSSTSSKILVEISCAFDSQNNYPQGVHIYRNGTQVTPNSSTSNGMYSYIAYQQAADTRTWAHQASNKYLDSPASTSALTYQVYGSKPSASSTNFKLNTIMGSSTITLMEIAG